MFRDLSAERNFALELALSQGKIMKDAFVAGTTTDTKADGTVVTDADLKISRNTVLSYSKRGIRTVSEEGGSADYGDTHVAVVDPIDGTRDFIDGQARDPKTSMAMYSLGLIGSSSPVMGVAYAPLLREPRLYGAIYGRTSIRYKNDMPAELLQVASSATTGVVLVSGGQWGRKIAVLLKKKGFRPLALQSSVFKAVAVADSNLVRAFDSTLLQPEECVVGFVSTGTYLHDYAASSVIVEAAGGIATAPNGGPLSLQAGRQGCVMSANRHIHEQLLEVVSHV